MRVVTLMLFLCLGCVAVAGEPPAVSALPHAAMQSLQGLVGEWRITSHFSDDRGESWQASPGSVVSIAYRQKDLFLMETPTDTSVPGFHVETVFSYDQYRKVYRVVAMDDTWGLMDVYEGTIVGDELLLTNIRSGTTFPMPGDKQRFFRLRVPLGGDRRTMVIDASEDGGENWFPSFRVEYQRLAEDR